MTATRPSRVAEGTIRPEIDPNDVLMGLGGVTLIAREPGRRNLAGRLLDLLVDGIMRREQNVPTPPP